jgi:hypothetical protein
MSNPLAEDPRLMWRLATFKANNPDVRVGHEWRARVPWPRGSQDIVCDTLQDLLDELEKMSSPSAVRQARTRRCGP